MGHERLEAAAELDRVSRARPHGGRPGGGVRRTRGKRNARGRRGKVASRAWYSRPCRRQPKAQDPAWRRGCDDPRPRGGARKGLRFSVVDEAPGLNPARGKQVGLTVCASRVERDPCNGESLLDRDQDLKPARRDLVGAKNVEQVNAIGRRK